MYFNTMIKRIHMSNQKFLYKQGLVIVIHGLQKKVVGYVYFTCYSSIE